MASASPIIVDTIEIENQSGDDSDTTEDRPIMLLLRSLIHKKQNTVMTNAQIIDILQKEYGIDTERRHELEVDIYIKIIKKYLKDWPQWEDLERVSSKLKNLNDYDAIKKVLNHKYKNLKEYLGVMLEIAKDAVLTIDEINKPKDKNIISQSVLMDKDVVMEINCTREQLNHLIFRYPKVDPKCLAKMTIFNTEVVEPKRIQCIDFSLKSILNFWPFKINITLPWFVCYRELNCNYEHLLVNKARKPSEECNNTLLREWQMKCFHKNPTKVLKSSLIYNIDLLLSFIRVKIENPEVLEIIFDIIKNDFNSGPPDFNGTAMYRRYCNGNKYVRNLCYDNNDDLQRGSNVDLQLEEYVSPQIIYYLCKYKRFFAADADKLPNGEDWLKVECLDCNLKFVGTSSIHNSIVSHYKEFHMNNNPDWQCTRCRNVYGMKYLADNKWSHHC